MNDAIDTAFHFTPSLRLSSLELARSHPQAGQVTHRWQTGDMTNRRVGSPRQAAVNRGNWLLDTVRSFGLLPLIRAPPQRSTLYSQRQCSTNEIWWTRRATFSSTLIFLLKFFPPRRSHQRSTRTDILVFFYVRMLGSVLGLRRVKTRAREIIHRQ